VEYLKRSRTGSIVATKLAAHDYEVHIPHLASIETVSALRTLLMRSLITAERARAAIEDLQDFAATRHPHEPYLDRAWALRHAVSAYDGLYVAMAEAMAATLVTCDARLARAPIPSVTIEVIDSAE
jgi:predicted nucleic acid-binding protein